MRTVLAVALGIAASCSSPSSPARSDAPAGDARHDDGQGVDAPADGAVSRATSWVMHYGGSDLGDFITAVAVDGDDNVYVTGGAAGTIDVGGGPLTSNGSTDILVASFTRAGVHRWSRLFGGAGIDQGAGITVAGGTVYVIAEFFDSVTLGSHTLTSAGDGDIGVWTLDATTGAPGTTAVRYGTVDDDTGLGIAVDGNGNMTIAGFFGKGTLALGSASLDGAGEDNGFVASFTSAGVHRWSRLLASNGASDLSSCQALALDAAGDVVTTGSFGGTVDFGSGAVTSAGDSDVFVASYSAAGAPKWSRVFGAHNGADAYAVSVDAAGNAFAGGSFSGSVDFGTGPMTAAGSLDGDGYVVGLDTSGHTRFARDLGAATSSSLRALQVSPSGDVAIAGTLAGSADLGTGPLAPLGEDDLVIASLGASTGSATFAARYGGADFTEGFALAVAPSGAIVVGGDFSGTVDLGSGSIAGGPDDNGFVMQLGD